MTRPDFAYLPKGPSISYKEVTRAAGHIPRNIHMHDHEEITLITSHTSCQITNNGYCVCVKTPAVIMNRSGSFHEVTEITEGRYFSRIVFFLPHILDPLPEAMRHDRQLFQEDLLILPLSDAQAEAFVPLFELLKTRPISQQLPLLLCVLAQMQQLLEEGVVPITHTARQSYILDIAETMRSAPEEKHTVAALAERFHVSQTKLKTDFKQMTGQTIKAFSNRMRLQKALALLESTQMDQAQIAYACGFSDESHFIESFRKVYAMTPGAYRRRFK